MDERRSMKRPSVPTHVARRRVPAAAVLAVAVVLALAGFAAARYVMQQQQDGLATATDFYFTSDYLKESGENATYFIDPGTESFTVELRNYADDLRTTSGDISYKVETTYATATDAGAGKLVGSAQSTAKVTVTPNSEVQEFAVTATSTSPYARGGRVGQHGRGAHHDMRRQRRADHARPSFGGDPRRNRRQGERKHVQACGLGRVLARAAQGRRIARSDGLWQFRRYHRSKQIARRIRSPKRAGRPAPLSTWRSCHEDRGSEQEG